MGPPFKDVSAVIIEIGIGKGRAAQETIVNNKINWQEDNMEKSISIAIPISIPIAILVV